MLNFNKRGIVIRSCSLPNGFSVEAIRCWPWGSAPYVVLLKLVDQVVSHHTSGRDQLDSMYDEAVRRVCAMSCPTGIETGLPVSSWVFPLKDLLVEYISKNFSSATGMIYIPSSPGIVSVSVREVPGVDFDCYFIDTSDYLGDLTDLARKARVLKPGRYFQVSKDEDSLCEITELV